MTAASREIVAILQKHVRGTVLTAQEKTRLEQWSGAHPQNTSLLEKLQDPALLREELALLDDYQQHMPALLQQFWEQQPSREQRPDGQQQASGKNMRVRRMPFFGASWLRYAAALIVLLACAGTYLYFHRPQKEMTRTSVTQTPDIPPGGNKAILTLSGGRQIILDSVHLGIVARQTGASITKTGSGRLAYTSSSSEGRDQKGRDSVSFNTLSTPRGGQYQLTLSDGTKVWLDAASSITYPTAFTGRERRVTISGQAYLEIAHDAGRPFVVAAGGGEIEDIGTAFNINAYGDEPDTRVTLVEGGIRVKKNGRGLSVRPGQQVVWDPAGIRPAVAPNLEAVLAWKNGQFSLKGLDMRSLMRQVARWYDVEVTFAGKIPDRQLGGAIGRNTSLSTVLTALRQYGLPCRQEGRRITVGEE